MLKAQKYQAICSVELSALSLMIIFKVKIGSAWLIFITPGSGYRGGWRRSRLLLQEMTVDIF